MNALQSFYLILFIFTFMVHISCVKIPFNEIEFQLYDYQPKPLPHIASSSANVIPGIAELTNALYAVSSTIIDFVEESKGQHLTDSMKKAIGKDTNLRNQMFILNILMSTIKYSFAKSKNSIGIYATDTYIFEAINKFADVKSPFHKYPTLAVPILLSLSTLVETFMKDIATPELQSSSKVPCNLADTIEVYFKPTLLTRLNHIQVNADYKIFTIANKYVFINNISKPKFNPNGYMSGDKEFVECYRGTGSYKHEQGTFGGKTVFIKDEFGNNSSYYYRDDQDVLGNCAMDYFGLVRYRLEKAFGEAFNKVNNLCKLEKYSKQTNSTGCGLLTIKLGAVLGELLPNGNTCDIDWVSGIDSHAQYCDLYVKITVKDTVYMTSIKLNSFEWVSYNETFYFPKLDQKSKIRIEIMDSDNIADETIFDQTFDIPYLVEHINFKAGYSQIFMISTWREEIYDSHFGINTHAKL